MVVYEVLADDDEPRGKSKSTRRVQEGSALVIHESDALYWAIEKAMNESYYLDPNTRTMIFDRDKASRLIRKVLNNFSRKGKAGAPRKEDVETAAAIFLKELKLAKLSLLKYRQLPVKEQTQFWEKNIWDSHKTEILGDTPYLPKDLIKEKKRIRDRVRRILSQPKRKNAITKRIKSPTN